MTPKSFATVQRTHAVLAVAAVAVGGLVAGAAGMLAVALGAGLSAGNLWAIRKLASRAVAVAELQGSDASVAAASGRLASGLLFKMMALFVLAYLVIRTGHVAVLPFAAGFFVLVPTLLVWGFMDGQRNPSEV